MSHHLRSLALATGILLLTAGSAAAAPGLTGVSAAPANPAAGAHSDFTVAFSTQNLGSDDVKSLRIDLPPGVLGNPQATNGTCPHEKFMADACPAGTKVGTTTVVADATLLVLDLGEQTIPGDVYNIPVSGGEAARLGIVLRPTVLGIPQPKQFLESPAFLRPGDGGLTSLVDNIPRTAQTTLGSAALRIDKQSLTLLAKTSGGGAFESNPTSCDPATTTVTIGTYDGATASGTGAFRPTGCDRLPFAPMLQATIGAVRNDVRPGAHPAVTVVVTQQPGEANARTVQVALPTGLGADARSLATACPLASYQAGTCPADAVVGSATAESPLLAGPLTGVVTYVAPGDGLPQLRIALRGALNIDLVGAVTIINGGRLLNTIDGIADVPLSRFALTIDAGPTSPVLVTRDLCDPGRGRLDGTFTAHSGKVATTTAQAVLPGCGHVPPPRVTARVGRLRAPRPALVVHAASPDRALTSVRLTLPRGLSFSKRARHRAHASLAGTRIAIKGRTLTATLPAGGANALDLRLARGGLVVSQALRRAQHPKPRLALVVRRAGLAAKHLTVRPRVVAKP